ncbi:MAG TPA: hypothetical protein VNJ01_12010 [Bacteriovoracaceae bacterium]|nr:hypothetical protein [Bacteriovoracaceae bacterium]
MKLTLLLVLLCVLASCASTMPGNDAESTSRSISASVSINQDLSEDNFKMFQVSIKNNTNKWIEIDSATFETLPVSEVDVLVGEKMSSWFEAKNLEKRVSDYNTSLVLGSVALAGAAVAVGSGHPQTSAVGAIALGGAVTASAARDLMESKNRAQFQSLFPATHIFHPFTIPPHKVVQRWILVEFKSDSEGKKCEIELTDGDKNQHSLEFTISKFE